MKRVLAVIAVLSSFVLLTGMGDLGGSSPPGKIPSPEKNFKVRLTDRAGVQTSLGEFSQDGKVFLSGKRGEAAVTIPFEKIAQVTFEPQQGNLIQASVGLRGEGTVAITMDRQAKFFAKADFGTFQIQAKDIKSVNFLP